LLLAPGVWLQEMRLAAWLAAGPLALPGGLVQALHVAGNVSYVYFRQGYNNFAPPFGFLFIPQFPQIPAHWDAVLAWDYRVDPWLVVVARNVGLDRAMTIGLLLGLIAWSLRQLPGNLRDAESAL